MLDLLAGEETERTATELVRTKPMPFPPEPLAYAGVQLTRASLAQADLDAGATQPVAAHARPARARLRLLSRETDRRRCDPVMGRDHTADTSNSSGSLDLNATGT